MKKLVVALLSLALVVAACGDDDAAEPASLDSCDALAVAGIAMLQDTIDLVDELSVEELAAFGETVETPAGFDALQARGDELSARATEIGCSDEEMADLVAARSDDLSADSVFGQFILDGVRGGDGTGFFGE